MIDNLPITEARLEDIQQTTCQLQQQMAECGWLSNITNVPAEPREYWKVCENLYTTGTLILMGDCLATPASR